VNTKRGFTPILIVVILGLAAVVGYFVFKSEIDYSATKDMEQVPTIQKDGPSSAKPDEAQPESRTTSWFNSWYNKNNNPTPWETYSNTKYGYQINFPSGSSYEESASSEYGITKFLNGCFQVDALPQASDLSEIIDFYFISRDQLNEIENLQVGATKTYSTPNWGEESFTLKIDYIKLPSKSISNNNWSAYEIHNNWEDYGITNMYFTNKNNFLYMIWVVSGGPCSIDGPTQMLSTFKFTD
jgi:hypothetical protein